MSRREYERTGQILAALAGGAALVIYLRTLAPTITWQHDGADSADLAGAAFTFGIPHPPGYPLFTVVGGLFAHLPGAEPAFGVGLFVAICAAAAVAVLARAGAALLSSSEPKQPAFFIPPLVAFGLALAPALWSQATIVEVYTLNLLFVAIILWSMASDHPGRIQVAALALGLGLAHHLTIALLIPGALLALRPTRRDWPSALLVLAPLFLYLYLPLRALADPPINWGDPRTLQGFLWVVTAAPYRASLFNEGFGGLAAHVTYAARLCFEQFTLAGVPLVLWGAVRLFGTNRRLFCGTGLSALLLTSYSFVYSTKDSFEYLLPVFAILFLWLMFGAWDLIGRLSERRLQYAAIVLIGLLPLFQGVMRFNEMDLSGRREAFQYASAIVDGAPDGVVLFADGDESLLSLVYYRYGVASARSNAVIVGRGMLQFDWYYEEMRRRLGGIELPPAAAVKETSARAVEITRAATAAGRPVCFAKSSAPLAEFDYDPVGLLQCVIGARE